MANETDFEERIDQLYQLPLNRFTGARNELAKILKKDGKRELGQEVSKLPKPSNTAWAVNQLYWRHREAFDQLAEASVQLLDAQRNRDQEALQRAMVARRAALGRLLNLGEKVMVEGGHKVGPQTSRRISDTLEALAATTDQQSLPGRLDRDLEPPGFEALLSMSFAPRAIKRKRSPDQPDRSEKETGPSKSSRLLALEQSIVNLEGELGRLEKTFESAQSSRKKHERERERATERVARLEQQLEEAKTQAEESEARLEMARDLEKEHSRVLDAARQRLLTLEARRDQMT